MINIENKIDCCGCHACYNICPKNAIKMESDEKGFKYPIIDKEKCINCGLCEKVCPIIKKAKKENEPKAYACINNNKDTRMSSSSGGIFTLIAQEIIKNNGVVFGARFDNDFNVVHDFAETIEDLEKFRGSKYVQSIISDTYKQVKEFLENDRYVLFTGTPCQTEGLYTYLGKDYEKLYTQDIICHGVPSPKVWNKYKEYLEKSQGSSIKNIKFRNKNTGWTTYSFSTVFENEKEFIQKNSDNIYMKAFLRNFTLRDSCYNCKFKKKNRISDITLADFWGIQNVKPELFDNQGISLVIINSKKGKELFKDIQSKMKFEEVELEEAIKYNPSMIESVKEQKYRKEFFEDLDKIEFDELVKKYIKEPNLIVKILSKIKHVILSVIRHFRKCQ